MNNDTEVRSQLRKLLTGEQAHLTFAEAVAEFPDAKINVKPARVAYSFWHLLEHLRISQWDILNYLHQVDYREIEWPKDYWPDPTAEATRADWDRSVADFESDLNELLAIVNDPRTDLFAPVPSTTEHSVLREIMIVGNHNSFHIGELGILRQIENAWGAGHL